MKKLILGAAAALLTLSLAACGGAAEPTPSPDAPVVGATASVASAEAPETTDTAEGQNYVVMPDDEMLPTISGGDWVYYRPIQPDRVAVGHKLVYYTQDGAANVRTVTGVIHEEGSDDYSYVVKGDANEADDPDTVPYDCVIGVMYDILYSR